MTLGERIREARERAGLTQMDVARHFNISRSAVSQWENDATDPSARVAELAALFNVDAGRLLTGDVPPPETAKVVDLNPLRGRPSEVRPAPGVEPPTSGAWPIDVPVLGTVVGGADDHFDLNGEIVNIVGRPRGLAGTQSIFGLYVVGDSMSPAFEPGELIYLAHRQPTFNDYVVIEMKPRDDGDGETRRAYLKRFLRYAGPSLIVKQYNPEMELPIPVEHIHRIYRVFTRNEIQGT